MQGEKISSESLGSRTFESLRAVYRLAYFEFTLQAYF
jgi:hypothetical protein